MLLPELRATVGEDAAVFLPRVAGALGTLDGEDALLRTLYQGSREELQSWAEIHQPYLAAHLATFQPPPFPASVWQMARLSFVIAGSSTSSALGVEMNPSNVDAQLASALHGER